MQLTIIGGGQSIQEGIIKGLRRKLEHKFTCGINYSYKFFETTYLCCMNYVDFYDANRQDLKELPLIVTCDRPHPSKWEDNTILVKKNYALSGILALSIAKYILGNKVEIYLLGYDYGAEDGLTHFYQTLDAIQHRGIGQTQYYDIVGHAERDFSSIDPKNVYNVSVNSKISAFTKLTYDEYFDRLETKTYNQTVLRNTIRRKLK